ncbi:MAG: hypothetical protein ABI229_00285 [Gemmatimonadaceae bacterium]
MDQSRRFLFVLIPSIVGFAILLPGCADEVVTAPRPSASLVPPAAVAIVLPPVQPGDSATADTLARAIALALGNPGIRRQLLEDLRDSPFPDHGIPLASYLGSARGRALSTVIAHETASVPTSRLIAMASVRGGIQLLMPISSDRANWSGSDSVIVAGSPFTVKEEITAHHRPLGYTVEGDTIAAPLLKPPRFPLFVLRPAEHSFGPDPETTRSVAPRHARNTITTFAEERVAMFAQTRREMSSLGILRPNVAPLDASCDPETAIIPCDPPNGTPGVSGVYLPSGGTMNSCSPNPGVPLADVSQDRDRDGVQDQCEYELANAFHPQMQFTSDDCDVSREPYWAATRMNSPIDGTPVIAIFYAISYHYDCGSPSPFCPTQCAGHLGDSEFIVEEVTTADYPNSDVHWYLKYATLSAHYGSQANSTGTYAGADLTYGAAAPGSNPFVWVAEGKHSNYRSQEVCDAGAYYFDNCDRPGTRVGLEVLPSANLGSLSNQLNPFVASRVGGVYSGVEHMWSTDPTDGFLGWYPRSLGQGETPYGKLLKDFGF